MIRFEFTTTSMNKWATIWRNEQPNGENEVMKSHLPCESSKQYLARRLFKTLASVSLKVLVAVGRLKSQLLLLASI